MARVLFQAKFGRITPGAGGLMVPQRERGVVQLIKDDDDCTRFQWFDATTNKVELDLLIFGEAAQFVNIPDKKGVFYLEFKETNNRHLFWSQEATSTPEFFANIARSINDILDETARSWSSQDEPMTPSSGLIEGGDEGDDEDDGDYDEDDDEELKKAIYLSMMADQNQASAAPAPASQSAASSSAFVQPDFLRALLSNASQQAQGKKKEPKLSDILDAEHLRSRLVGMSEEEVKSLVQHLPEGHTTLTDILDVIHSAQFQQAVDSFHGAMLSGELHSICLQCGLDPSKAVGNSVIEAFLNALQFQVKNSK